MNNNYPQWPSAATSFTTTQWSTAETKELVAARAELDAAFMESKRNRLLWDRISSKLLSLGFTRSADQCKYRWKNLVTRYKAIEALGSESAMAQFPFLLDLRAIIDARLPRMMSQSTAAEKGAPVIRSSYYEDEEDPMLTQALHAAQEDAAGKRRKDGGSSSQRGRAVELFEEFVRQQERMDEEWRREQEAREAARVAREREWMQAMVAVERERLEAERRWMDAEEQRRSREEDRAVRRDALITALVDRLLHGGGAGGGDQQ